MHVFSILSIIAFGHCAANAVALEHDNMLDTRAQCSQSIELMKLKLKPGKSFTGVGKPAKCYSLFNINSDDTKSLVACFDCKVYTGKHCLGSLVSLEGEKAFKITDSKNSTYKSWKCECKD
ncbi:hypothetical protein ACHAPU_002697 [Fusarium lateritium]